MVLFHYFLNNNLYNKLCLLSFFIFAFVFKLDVFQAKERELSEANGLVKELKNRVQSLEDSNKLLQIEKEKAMSDLITMKKNIKEKER